jgi:hypothetical protein
LSDETLKIDNLTITIRTAEYKPIHPAIGVVDGIAYVGVWYPCDISDHNGNTKTRDLLFLVTSKRNRLLANDHVLRQHGWRLEYKPLKFSNRWPLAHLQTFLDGKTVEPIDVFYRVAEVYKRFIEFSDPREYAYHALWDIGTYFHHLFASFPYLYVGGTKRTGKTKTLTLHSAIAHNAFFSNNMSISSIYRLIQNTHGTLLIDETEKLSAHQMSERTLEFRSIILSGYKKGGHVYRTEKSGKDMFETRAFEVYSPKGLASIEGLEDVLEDRCRTTIQKRSRNQQIMNCEPDVNSDDWPVIRSDLYVLFLCYWEEVKAIYGELSVDSERVNVFLHTFLEGTCGDKLENLVGREFELWKPILALAIFFDRHSRKVRQNKYTGTLCSLSSLMLRLALESAEQRNIENMTETSESILVQVMLTIVQKSGFYRVKILKDEMAKEFDEPQQWLTTRWVGNALKRLGFKEKRRVGSGYEYKLDVDGVKDLAARMGVKNQEFGLQEKLDKARQWIRDNRDKDGLIETNSLAVYLKELGIGDPSRIIEVLKHDNCLFPVSTPGKLGAG